MLELSDRSKHVEKQAARRLPVATPARLLSKLARPHLFAQFGELRAGSLARILPGAFNCEARSFWFASKPGSDRDILVTLILESFSPGTDDI